MVTGKENKLQNETKYLIQTDIDIHSPYACVTYTYMICCLFSSPVSQHPAPETVYRQYNLLHKLYKFPPIVRSPRQRIGGCLGSDFEVGCIFFNQENIYVVELVVGWWVVWIIDFFKEQVLFI